MSKAKLAPPPEAAEIPGGFRKQNLVIDLETSDPDDVWNLLLLGGHPLVDLKGVTVYPGTPAQLLLVHHALNRLATAHPALAYLEKVPIGYYNIEQDLIGRGRTEDQETKAKSADDSNPELTSMLQYAEGDYYQKVFEEWIKQMKQFTPKDKAAQKKAKARKQKFNGSEKKKNTDGASPTVLNAVTSKVKKQLDKDGRKYMPGFELLIDESSKIVDDEDGLVYVTGGPVSNLGEAIRESRRRLEENNRGERNILKLRRWVAQGGFAGKNVVDQEKTPTPSRCMNEQYNPAWNFDLDHESVKEVMKSNMIQERYIVSKNVCHRVVFAQPVGAGNRVVFGTPVDDAIAFYDKEGVGIGVSLDQIETAWQKVQRTAATPTDRHPPFLPSYGLPLFVKALRDYERADRKKLHDLVAGLAALHLGYSGVVFRKVIFGWKAEEPFQLDNHSAKKDATKKERADVAKKHQQQTQSFASARNKNGGEWGCRDVTKQPAFICAPDAEESRRPYAIDALEKNVLYEYDDERYNAFISVDINLDTFLKGLLGSRVAGEVFRMRDGE